MRGSSGIEADFAGKALQDYQELVAKQVASAGGALAERGRLPDQIHEAARLNVTALMHGSFGFVLEEDTGEQVGMFDTPAHSAVRSVTDLLEEVASFDGARFEARIHELDIRIFHTLKRFIGTLHKAGSTLRVAEDQRELKLDVPGVERAFERVSQVDVEEVDETLEGESTLLP